MLRRHYISEAFCDVNYFARNRNKQSRSNETSEGVYGGDNQGLGGALFVSSSFCSLHSGMT